MLVLLMVPSILEKRGVDEGDLPLGVKLDELQDVISAMDVCDFFGRRAAIVVVFNSQIFVRASLEHQSTWEGPYLV
ncbi:MAG: hypothetical protein ABT02_05785 [Comamonadaceae bacterium SCN 68-20]|nr:MAG: hypothetical protein ABT02_05785 [Comamonadaceae bacterium SCN 68-20]